MQKKDNTKIIELIRKYLKGYRKTNLNREAPNYTSFQTLISCILSLRSQDETTEKISKNLFRIAKTPEKILKLGRRKLERIIYSSGYYKNKAKAIREISKSIIRHFKGKVPNTEEELLSLYGVGRKTANIVLSLSHKKDVIAVDTHVHIIANRLGWVKTKNADQTEIGLMKILPKNQWRHINGILVLFGKKVCTSISPFCTKCPVNKYCKKIGVKKFR